MSKHAKSNNGDTLAELDAMHAECVERIRVQSDQVRFAKTRFDEAAKFFESSVMELQNIHTRIKVWKEEMHFQSACAIHTDFYRRGCRACEAEADQLPYTTS